MEVAMLNFEEIESSVTKRLAATFLRAKVPGGWLLILHDSSETASVSFYPDPGHSWDGSSID
jgi:hypothetical protein